MRVQAREHHNNYQTCRDRTQQCIQAFNVQLLALMDAYMGWMLQLGEDGYSGEYVLPPNAEVQAMTNICEIYMYHESYNSLFVFLPTIYLISGL